jgi:PAS domain S-box-containing protein
MGKFNSIIDPYFLSLFDNQTQSIVIVSPDFKIIQFNAAFSENARIHFSKKVKVGVDIFEYLICDSNELTRKDFLKSFSGEKVIAERWVNCQHEKKLCYTYEFSPLTVNSEIIGVILSMIEITGLKASSSLLELSSNRFLKLLDGHQTAYFLSRAGVIIKANDSALTMFGYPLDEIYQLNKEDLFDSNDPKLALHLKQREKNNFATTELVGIKKNGDRFPIELSSVLYFDELTGEQCASNVIIDLSKSKRDEKILLETNIATHIGGWELNLRDNRLYWSDETKLIHEVEPDYIPNLDDDINFYKEGNDRKKIAQLVQQAIEAGEPFESEFQIITHKGNKRWVNTKGFVEFFNGKPLRLYGTFQDINEQKSKDIEFEKVKNQIYTYFQSTNESICLLDFDCNITGFNKVFKDLVFRIYNKQVKIGDSIFEYTPKHTIEDFKANFQKAIKGNTVNIEREIHFEIFSAWWAVKYIPIKNPENETIGIAFVSSDISEEKKKEFEILESRNIIEANLSELNHQKYALDQHAIVDVTDSSGVIIYVNDKLCDLTGYSREELIGSNHRLIKSGIHPNSFYDELYNTIYQGNVWMGDMCNKSKTGEYIWLSTTIVPYLEPNENFIKQFICIRTDITKKKSEEQQLKLLESVITNANDAVIITEAEPIDNDGPKIVYVNEAFTRNTGYTKDDVIGKTPRILQGPYTSRNELDRLKECLKNKQPCEVEIVNYKKNGEPFWVNFSIVPIADERGWFTHWISIQRDITKRKEDEEERQLLIEELSISLKELKQFTYITSHNMRAPITNLLGIFSVLDTSQITDEFTLKLIEGIRTSTNNLNETLNDLIKILIIKENINLTVQELKFEEVLEKVKLSINDIIESSDAKINYNFKEAEYVNFNKSYLDSIFLNLITNSIRYADPERKIIIDIKSRITRKGNFQLLFSDNGLGMDMQKVGDEIFGLYKVFHKHPDSKGMGLYLVHSQVTALGGTITVDSKVGVGTTFTITF